MKNLVLFIVALILDLSSAWAGDFWIPLGPVGGVVENIIRVPNGSVFLSSGSGVYRSGDQGQTWRYIGLKHVKYIFSLAADSAGRVYAGCDSGRIYRSVDHGGSWQEIKIPGIGSTFITNLAASKRGDLFAWIRGYGIYYSSDAGDTWTHSFSYSDTYDKIWCLSLINDSTLFAGASDGSVFRSSDYGRTLEAAGVIMKRGRGTRINVFAQIPSGDIIAGTDGGRNEGGVYRYDPLQNSWQQSAPSEYTIRTIITTQDGVMYMGPHSLLRSLDSGRTWEDIGGYDGINIYGSICDAGDGVLLAGTSAGVYRSTDRGETWERSFEELNAHYVTNISITPEGTILAATGTGIFSSDDQGITWDHLGFTDTLVYMVGTTPGGDYIASLETQGENRIVRSTDKGKTWAPSSEGFYNANHQPQSPSYGSHMVSVRGRLFAVGPSGVYYSDDDGNTWTYVYYADHEGSAPLEGSTTGIAVTKEGIFYTSTTSGGIYRSEDGLVWKNVYAEKNNETYTVDVAVNSKGRVYVLGSRVAWHRIYVSDDGKTWHMHRGTRIDSVMETSALFIDRRDSIWVGTEEGVFRMEPTGKNAENISSGLMNLNVQAFAQDSSGHLYAGTLGGGLYRSANPVAVSVPDKEEPVSIARAVPNPVSDEVQLLYRLPAGGRVRVAITDGLGREVFPPLQAVQPAGEQRLLIPAQHLGDGTYFFRIEAESSVQTGVFTVVK